MKSLSRSSSSSPTRRTPSWAARAGWMYGSYAISRVPKAAMRCANSTPIRPSPTTPTVLPCTSTPVYFDRFHSPSLSAALALAVLPGDGEQQRDRLLGGGDDVGGGRVDDHDAAGGGGRHVDVVQADAGPGDHLEPGRGGDRLGVDLGGAAHDHRVGVGQRGEQRRPVGAVDVADVEVVGEHVDGGRGEFLGDQYDRSHAILVDVVRRSATARTDAHCAQRRTVAWPWGCCRDRTADVAAATRVPRDSSP